MVGGDVIPMAVSLLCPLQQDERDNRVVRGMGEPRGDRMSLAGPA